MLGAALAAVAATRLGAVTALVACTAVIVRWGAPSLAASAGAQAVLGPALALGTSAAAWAMVLAAAAVATLAVPRRWELLLPVGAAAGAIAAGPAFPHELVVRAVGIVAGTCLAGGMALLPFRRTVAVAGVVLAIAAVALASLA